MPRFYLAHFLAAAAPHRTLSLSQFFIYCQSLLLLLLLHPIGITLTGIHWSSLQVSWYQNSFPIQTTDRRIMNTRANRHTLTIRHIQQEDFGNYRWVLEEARQVVGHNKALSVASCQLLVMAAVQPWFSQFGNFCYNLFHFRPATFGQPTDTHMCVCMKCTMSGVWACHEACPDHYVGKQVFHINVNLSETY